MIRSIESSTIWQTAQYRRVDTGHVLRHASRNDQSSELWRAFERADRSIGSFSEQTFLDIDFANEFGSEQGLEAWRNAELEVALISIDVRIDLKPCL
jgi:hypothetical protein